MDDTTIVQLYWDRDERAIPATSGKYGNYCNSIAWNILGNREDAEECVNDTYLCAWTSMPPHRPRVLSAFLGKLTRNLSLNRYKHHIAEKRGGGEAPAVLDEIAELVRAIDTFLERLPADKRRIFVCRYWYFDPVSKIASRFGMTENHVSVTLNRLRLKLHNYLQERGFDL